MGGHSRLDISEPLNIPKTRRKAWRACYRQYHSLQHYCGEISAYKWAVMEAGGDMQPLTFWFAICEQFPVLFDIAVRYLSVPGNSVDLKWTVSKCSSVPKFYRCKSHPSSYYGGVGQMSL